MRTRLSATACTAAIALASGSADAYVARTTADGTPVRWGESSVSVIADQASLDLVDPGALVAAEAALATWRSVGGALAPDVSLEPGSVDEIGYRPGEENHSTLRFAPSGFEPAGGALAVTIVTFDDAGTILDADTVISGGPGRRFGVLSDEAPAGAATSASASNRAYDVQNVLTHEAGHFFGLAHNTDDPEVTMYPAIGVGETSKRVLAADDEEGLRALYPGGARAFTASCAARPGSPAAPLGLLGIAALTLGLGALARRRTARRLAFAAAVCAAGLSTIGPAGARVSSTLTTRVTAATARWEGGLLTTRLELDSGEGPIAIEVFGGTAGGLTQVVGHEAIPKLGATVEARRGAGGLVWPFPVRHSSADRPQARAAGAVVPDRRPAE